MSSIHYHVFYGSSWFSFDDRREALGQLLRLGVPFHIARALTDCAWRNPTYDHAGIRVLVQYW